MRVSKAREILELNIAEAGKHMPPDVKKAVELGVEAIKLYQKIRDYPSLAWLTRLPGETDDNGGH